MYTVLKKLNNQTKVSRFSSTVGDYTNYHHGEASLIKAICKLTQPIFNKIPLIFGEG
jgi:DNA gyrase/topoisomerase IV subunit A